MTRDEATAFKFPKLYSVIRNDTAADADSQELNKVLEVSRAA